MPSSPVHSARAIQATILVLLLLLAGCAGTPRQPEVVETPPPVALEAEQALMAGDAARAAELWLQAARLYPERAAEFLLRSASAWLETDTPARAREVLSLFPQAGPTPQQQARARLLAARVSLLEHDPEAALEQLDFDPEALPPETRAEYHRLRAEAYLETGNYLESARQRVHLDALLPEGEARIENEFALWEALSHLSTHALEVLESPDELGGWLALTRLLRQHAADPEQFEAALEAWRRQWPDHPADRGFIERLLERRRRLVGQRPHHMAVLLPLSGRLATAGRAIQDGLIAAYYEALQQNDSLSIEFHDTRGDPNQAWSLYHAAVEAGADFVIGPLHRKTVDALARAGELRVPVLALNRVSRQDTEGTPVEIPAGFFQFPLAPEDEAATVAAHAARRGLERSLALLPEGRLGQRMLDAYLVHWEDPQSSRRLLEAVNYPDSPRQLSGVVSRLLNIDSSRRRYQELVRTLGMRPRFEPRPRKDADHVFLTASPVMGRLLRPLLRFHRASALPVLATSSIYSGHVAPETDRDLDGIEFCDIPWLIDPTPEMADIRKRLEQGRHLTGSLLRLTALGYDALMVAPLLPALQAGLLPSHAGATGQLTLDGEGRLHRGLRWARFENGIPRVLQPQTRHPLEAAQGGADDDEPEPSETGKPGRDSGLSLPGAPGAAPPDTELSQPIR